MLADAPADGINTIVGGRFLVHRKVQNKHQQQKSSPRGGRGSKEAENKNSVAPRVRGQKVKRPPIHRVSGVRGSKVFFLLGFNRVSHGASFLAPGSLARRRPARVINSSSSEEQEERLAGPDWATVVLCHTRPKQPTKRGEIAVLTKLFM